MTDNTMETDDDSEINIEIPRSTTDIISLDFADITNDRCFDLTGFNKEEFFSLYYMIANYKHELHTRVSIINALGFYLCKLRCGLSIKKLSALIPIASYGQIKKCIKGIRDILSNHFVDRNLGFGHITRESLIKDHTTDISKNLLGALDNNLISVWDATYVYIEKSSNYKLQKSTYSGHKERTLVKFMLLVATDGYIIDTVGPYLADGKNNDASILIDTFDKNISDIESNFQPDDIFVVDRGFRDCLKFLEENNMQYGMPGYLQHGKQHSTIDANISRLITKVKLKF